jgi:menaquinone-dependent protoporphyrinogen IX oxidase
MRHMKISRNIIIVIACSVLLQPQCVKNIRETEVGPAEAKNKILIAAYYSDFKNTVTQGLVDRFKNKAKITVVPLEKIGKVDPYQYNVLVVIDALMAWQMFNPWTKSFVQKLNNPEEKKKLILFLTAGNPKKNYKFSDVDCITAASQANKEGEILEEISARINSMLRQ